MNDQFRDQGGAATSEPSRLYRYMTSTLMTRISREKSLVRRRAKAERKRSREGRPHVVEYFHQVDDGYSHLAAQVLPALARRYDIELKCHVVPGPAGHNLPEPELLIKLARVDAAGVAPHFNLQFSDRGEQPTESLMALATSVLARLDDVAFIEHCAEVGRLLWDRDADGLQVLADRLGRSTDAETRAALDTGFKRRDALGHYSGGMFYYEGEWYWGVDRLYHLEARLTELGVNREPVAQPLVPRPPIECSDRTDNGSITFEIYPSLRSPYTAIIFDRAIQLARDTGVNLKVRPVLPMVMRGVPATRQKGVYIFTDVAREARAQGLLFDNFKDPIGEPVRRAYSLYPWAREQGREIELLSCFLRAAFVDGINTNTDRGLQTVVENAGLDWSVAKTIIGSDGWQDELEQNRLAMYDAGLWGVPSFRLIDADGKVVRALWGQDRLWLFSRDIKRLIEAGGHAA